MRTERFCFFHLNAAPLNCKINSQDSRPDENFVLPVLEDATSIQFAISQVLAHLLRGYIDDRRAKLLLSACKLASFNLNRMDTEKPLPTQMLVDVKTIPTTPMGSDDLWSATADGQGPALAADQTTKQPPADKPTGTLLPDPIQACEGPRRYVV